jgi:hypothetical protein
MGLMLREWGQEISASGLDFSGRKNTNVIMGMGLYNLTKVETGLWCTLGRTRPSSEARSSRTIPDGQVTLI